MRTTKRRGFVKASLATATGFLLFRDVFIKQNINVFDKTSTPADEDYILVNNWYLKKDDLNSDHT